MKVTLAIEPDIAARLKRLQQRHDARFEDVVNEVLREGLRTTEEGPQARPKSWTRPRSLGGSLVGNLDNIAEVLSVTGREAEKP